MLASPSLECCANSELTTRKPQQRPAFIRVVLTQKGASDMALMRKIGDGAGAGLNLAQVAFLKDEDLPAGQPSDIELEYELLTRSRVDHAPAREHPTAAE